MTIVKGRLEKIVESAVLALNYELVGCEILPMGKSTVLRVYVDSEDGIDIDAIEQVSHQVAAILNVEEPIPGEYTLEVSSPGLDRPLFKLKDYHRFIGSTVKLRLRIPHVGERSNYTGVLLTVDAEQITLELEQGERVTIDYKEVQKANLVPEFE